MFEWKVFPRHTTLQLSQKIQKMMMYNHIDWEDEKNKDVCIYNSETVSEYAKIFPKRHWSFLGPQSEEKCYGTHTYKPNGAWVQDAEKMLINFSESEHPVISRITEEL